MGMNPTFVYPLVQPFKMICPQAVSAQIELCAKTLESPFLAWREENSANSAQSRDKTNGISTALSKFVFAPVLAVGAKYWNKQGGKCLCEEQDKERLFSFLGILGSEWRKSCAGHLDPSLFQYFTPTASMWECAIIPLDFDPQP